MHELRIMFSILMIGIIVLILVINRTGVDDMDMVGKTFLWVWAAIIGGMAIVGTALAVLYRFGRDDRKQTGLRGTSMVAVKCPKCGADVGHDAPTFTVAQNQEKTPSTETENREKT
jgi:hypothetical protein